MPVDEAEQRPPDKAQSSAHAFPAHVKFIAAAARAPKEGLLCFDQCGRMRDQPRQGCAVGWCRWGAPCLVSGSNQQGRRTRLCANPL